MEKLPYLNLGCGSRYHPQWTNLDFHGKKDEIIGYNLLKGIPFPDHTFEVAYHSHVLEHFSKTDGRRLIAECNRVLKTGGVLRIAIPDLESIVREYLANMEKALSGDKAAADNYEWIMLEMYDQAVRHNKGGHMVDYLLNEKLPNRTYVIERIGREAEAIWANKKDETTGLLGKVKNKTTKELFTTATNVLNNKIESLNYFIRSKFYKLGKYRLGGEIHQWMYDRYSLKKLLEDNGFTDVTVRTAYTSSIASWESYQLDTNKNGEVNKPDSLFIEGTKK